MSGQEYEDPKQPGALGGVRPFARAHKLKDPEAQELLQQVLSYTLHKPVRKRFPTTPTLVFGPNEQWQMDLVDMQKLSKWNKGYKYLLTVIDVFSKVAWAEPIKSKSTKEMLPALERVKKHYGTSPLRVQTDQGTEFLAKPVQAWFKKHGWLHFVTHSDPKASVIERWHRTLKQRMFRYFTAHNTLRWLDVLPHLIHNYNKSFHRSIGMAPLSVLDRPVGQNPRSVLGIKYAYKRNTAPSKKAICRDGPKKSLVCPRSRKDPSLFIKSWNRMGPLSKARFTNKICKKFSWMISPCFAWRKC